MLKKITKQVNKNIFKKIICIGMIFILTISIFIITLDNSKETIEESDDFVRRVNAKVALYSVNTNSGGSAPGSSIPNARMFEYAGCDVQLVDTADILNGVLESDDFDIVCFTGGNAGLYTSEFNTLSKVNKIRDFISNGGAYLGICAGGYFAGDCIWEGWDGSNVYQLDLYEGKCVGPLSYTSPWYNYDLCTIDMVDSDFPSHNGEYQTMYYGGAYFDSTGISQSIDVVAEYVGGVEDGKAAMIKFEYGSGRVFLSGPHPEHEENGGDLSNPRDWALWNDYRSNGNPLIDPETEWDFMADEIGWLAPDTVTYEKKIDVERSIPPSTPYRAAVLASGGVRTRTLFSTCKMLDYYGITPIIWNSHCNIEITSSKFDLVVMPEGDESKYDDYVNTAILQSYFDAGGAGMGIGAGCIWFEDEGYYSGTIDSTPPSNLTHGLEPVTIVDSDTGTGEYDIFWIDDWFCDDISMPNPPSGVTTVGYFSDVGTTEAAMVKFEYGTNNAPIFLSSVSLQMEESYSLTRDGSYWDNDYNDPDSEWDLMENILNWMGFDTTNQIADTTKPVISNIQAEDTETNKNLNITVEITDNINISKVWINIDSIGNYSMEYDSDTGLYYYNATYSEVGTYDYIISVNDTSNNWNSTTGQFKIIETSENENNPLFMSVLGLPVWNWIILIVVIVIITIMISKKGKGKQHSEETKEGEQPNDENPESEKLSEEELNEKRMKEARKRLMNSNK